MQKNSNNKKESLSSDELRQKVIYYQAEAAKYKFLSEKYELIITQALQSKEIRENEDQHDTKTNQRTECTSFFNYSLIQDPESSPMVYGNYIIKNTGEVPLHTPVICLKVNEPNAVSISGKIGEVAGGENKLISSFTEWNYVHSDWRKKWSEEGELWLRPKQVAVIEPGDNLVFSGFDVIFKNNDNQKSIRIEGFCYFQQFVNGVKSLNSISLTL